MIKEILAKSELARDDDNALYVHYLYEKGYNPNSLTVIDMMRLISHGKILSFDSVTRLRREAQQINEDLRGKKYVARQEKAGRYADRYRHGR